ncbi:hypothetical protein HDA40_002773 [Hamadaea flava]|nr:hypothetical protein [Hamadaea flava]
MITDPAAAIGRRHRQASAEAAAKPK